ncbi:hypothetical protein, partial [Methylobacterium segetis]|uniref:hypothetical protein n=1 Tax=Methylobacterium segetis TaxID=2488750 RepID=UPI001A9D686F
ADTSSITAEASHVPPSQVMQPANGADPSGTTKLTGVEEHATQTEPRSPTSGEAVPQSQSTEASDLSQTKTEGATENGRAADILHQVPETAPNKSADIAVSHSAAHSTNALPQIAVQPPQTNATAPALATIDADGNLVFGAGAGHSSPLPPGDPVPSPYPQEADQNSGVGLVGIASLHNPLHHSEIH